ncbi:MAG: LarC family nickel insertion protein [Lachnospiraceae bacterium]|nr:LarC family nickel insertion protein [Lachnospiraceae bacterium]
MKTLYLECNTGISGDMIVAALLDLGASRDALDKALSGINDKSFSIKIGRVIKSGIDCCDFDVVLDEEHDGHDHDMEYLYGHGHEGHDHHHDHDHEHHHDHDHHHHEHAHSHRSLSDIVEIIDGLDLKPGAKDLAIKVFDILAHAEAKAHNKDINEVHFHEVGAIDSIVDIVSAAVCFDDLGITNVIIPRLCEGTGSVRCQHGILPVPVPAVLNIAAAHSLPISITDRKGEYVTPTGAAFAAAVMTSSRLPDVFIPVKVGLGAGKRDHEVPGILRAILIKDE